MRQFFISVRSYFANGYLKNMFFNESNNFVKLIFSKGNEKSKTLLKTYESFRSGVEKKLNDNAKNVKVDINLPYDYNMIPTQENFAVSYVKPASWSEKEGVVAVVNLPKPNISGEAWAVMALYNYKDDTRRFYTLDFDGYKQQDEAQDFLNAKFVVSQWKDVNEKVKIGKANNFAEVMTLLEEQNNLKDKIQ